MELEFLSRQPQNPSQKTPLLFIHGAWHAAWCWDRGFMAYFAARGYPSYALSYRGHGGSEGRQWLRWTSVRSFVQDVGDVITRMPAPPVLIGHSMGGLVVQKYLETHTAPAGVLLAAVPPGGVLPFVVYFATRHPLAFARALLSLNLYPVVGTPALAQEILFPPQFDPDQLAAIQARLQDESFIAFLDILAFYLPRPQRVKTPMLFLGGGQDKVFSTQVIRRAARAYGSEAVIFPEIAHDMMLDPGWEQVARHIYTWLTSRGL